LQRGTPLEYYFFTMITTSGIYVEEQRNKKTLIQYRVCGIEFC